jgi:uncharacterized protein (TIGR02996 family)
MSIDLINLRKAILAAPAEDTPRLLYADALDEAAGFATKHAEFIRWGVAHPQDEVVCFCGLRERLLQPCETCRMFGEEVSRIPVRESGETPYVIHRGFVSELRFDDFDDIMGEGDVPCPQCEDRAPDYETNVIECEFCDCTGSVGTEWQPIPAIAREAKRHPIERVQIRCRRPVRIESLWNWMRNEHLEPESSWFLPEVVWGLIDLPIPGYFTNAKYARTEQEALTAAWAALAKFVKGQ